MSWDCESMRAYLSRRGLRADAPEFVPRAGDLKNGKTTEGVAQGPKEQEVNDHSRFNFVSA